MSILIKLETDHFEVKLAGNSDTKAASIDQIQQKTLDKILERKESEEFILGYIFFIRNLVYNVTFLLQHKRNTNKSLRRIYHMLFTQNKKFNEEFSVINK